jgi:hypothetical protein
MHLAQSLFLSLPDIQMTPRANNLEPPPTSPPRWTHPRRRADCLRPINPEEVPWAEQIYTVFFDSGGVRNVVRNVWVVASSGPWNNRTRGEEAIVIHLAGYTIRHLQRGGHLVRWPAVDRQHVFPTASSGDRRCVDLLSSWDQIEGDLCCCLPRF